jgi:hypothetical protein
MQPPQMATRLDDLHGRLGTQSVQPNPLVLMAGAVSDAILFGIMAMLTVAYVFPRSMQPLGWLVGFAAVIVGGILGYRMALR